MNSIKISARFFVDIAKTIFKFIWKGKGARIAKTILKRRIKKEESVYPISKRITTVIKTLGYWWLSIPFYTNQCIEWNRQPINRPTQICSCFFTRVQKQFNEGKIGFSTNVAGTIVHPYVQAKTEVQLKQHTLYKNYLKMDHRLKVE